MIKKGYWLDKRMNGLKGKLFEQFFATLPGIFHYMNGTPVLFFFEKLSQVFDSLNKTCFVLR